MKNEYFVGLSPAQQEARWRNARIRMLRGLYCAAKRLLAFDKAAEVMKIVDQQLVEIGAQSHTEREQEERKATDEMTGYYKGYGKRRKFVPYEKPGFKSIF